MITFDRALNVALAAAALIMASAFFHHEFIATPRTQVNVIERSQMPAVQMPNWKQAADSGIHEGPVGAPITVLEFADF